MQRGNACCLQELRPAHGTSKASRLGDIFSYSTFSQLGVIYGTTSQCSRPRLSGRKATASESWLRKPLMSLDMYRNTLSMYVTIIGITGSASKAFACFDLVAWPAAKGHYKLAG